MRLTSAQRDLLHAMNNGGTLKAHRYLDGTKEYRLHWLDRPAEIIERRVVDVLQDQGLIGSNKKFPAATFWLTETGRAQIDSSASHRNA